MSFDHDLLTKFERLREQAEQLLQKQPDFNSKSSADVLESIHELQICYTELEIQNDELKRAQQEILSLQGEYEDLYEFAPCGYLTLSSQGLIVKVNLTGVLLLGTNRRGILQRRFSNLIDSCYQNAYFQTLKQADHTGEKQTTELKLAQKEGLTVWIRMDIQTDSAPGGDVIQRRIILTDITDQRRAEEDKKELEEQLWQARKMESLGTLAGGIAHEFNNMLAIIMGNSEVALDDLPKWSPTYANIKEIMSVSLKARDMVRQLLTFGRKNDTLKKPLDAKVVVTDALKLIRSSLPANIIIKEEISDDVASIIGNLTQINQVLINLCGNAADAMQTMGDTLTIALSNKVIVKEKNHGRHTLAPGRYVQLVVSDNGCGMDVETLNRIYDPFFTTKAVGKGTGLGLAVVHGIVNRHGGVILVESRPDKGTVFKILFPAYKGSVEPEFKAPTVLATGTERILFVDDEPLILKLFQQRLENLGYRVYATIDPVDALKAFEADPDGFDLMITDMAMPCMTGDQLAVKILSIRPEIPIMLCTGYSEKISPEKAYKLGICSFAMKPLDQTDFVKSVREVLDRVKNEAEEINQY
jgi:signal transduction histidine kinase/ActR/RegA family two-component response regulator